MSMQSPVTHFEVYGRNSAALREFYAAAFGWTIHYDESMKYGLVHQEEGDRGIGGGIGEGDPRVNFVIEVDDLEKKLAEIEQLGGKTVTPITVIPDVVTFAEFSDPEGNVIGISKSG
jgi:predicted enzyme related to lactoylglutathione lyase